MHNISAIKTVWTELTEAMRRTDQPEPCTTACPTYMGCPASTVIERPEASGQESSREPSNCLLLPFQAVIANANF